MVLATILAAGKSELHNFCMEANFLKALKIISTVILIIKIVAPVILIITSIISLAKVVIAGEETKDAVRTLITKTIIAVFIFFIPSFVYSIMGLVNGYNNKSDSYSNCIECLKSPSSCGTSSFGH